MASTEGQETSAPSAPELEEEANRAGAFLQAARFQDAAISIGRVLEHEPDDVAALLVAGRAALGLGDWAGAARHLERAARLKPSEEAELGWARALAADGRIEQAVWRFDRAASLDETSAEALLRAGDLLLGVAREDGVDDARRSWALEEARKRLIAATGIDGAPPVAWLRLGETYQEQEAFARALKAFEKAVQHDPDLLEARVGVAEMANNRERHKRARRAVEPVLRKEYVKGDFDLLILLAKARLAMIDAVMGLREWERAREVIAGLFDLLAVEEQASELLLQARCLMMVQDSGLLLQLGQLDEAVRPAEDAVERGGEEVLPYASLMLVAVHTARGDYGTLADTLVRADESYSGTLPTDDVERRSTVVQLRVAVLKAQREAGEAYALLREECGRHPERLELHMELVKLVARERAVSSGVEAAKWQHRLVQAAAEARRALAPRASLRSADLSYGAIEILVGEWEAAKAKLLSAVERDPGSFEAHALLGIANAQLQDHRESARSFSRAIRMSPQKLHYKLGLASAYVHLGNSAAAEACYREVHARAPMNVEALVGLGTVLGSRDEAHPSLYEEAGRFLSDALDAADTMNADLASQRASIGLSKARRAAIYHQIGYVRTREFEAEANAGNPRRRPKLLRAARREFAMALKEDKDMFLAKRAKERVDRERRALLAERPKWPLVALIGALIAVLSLSFFAHRPNLAELSGPTYSAMTLGLLVLLMAAFYMDQLRSLSVAGVSMQKDVEVAMLAAKLGVEAYPDIIELFPPDIEPPRLLWPSDSDSSNGGPPAGGDEFSARQARQGTKATTAGDPAATEARSGARSGLTSL